MKRHIKNRGFRQRLCVAALCRERFPEEANRSRPAHVPQFALRT